MNRTAGVNAVDHSVQIPIGETTLEGNLIIPDGALGIVLFAHGSGSSRHSPRNQWVARQMHTANLGTLLIDLLTPDEDKVDQYTRQYRFDIPRLAGRLVTALDWLQTKPETAGFNVGLFGASTGAGAALIAAAELLLDLCRCRGRTRRDVPLSRPGEGPHR